MRKYEMHSINPETQFFSVKALTARYDVSRSTIWRWTSKGTFPQPIRMYGTTRWNLDDLKTWEQSFNEQPLNVK